jgi:peptidoglycan/xylan/chitin deacetylase (PgdA/CDA1 family)
MRTADRRRLRPLKRAAYLYHRFRSLYSYRNDVAVRLDRPILSFTFDDFPASAAESGGAVLRAHGAQGTFYASFGLAGRETLVGRIAGLAEIERLLRDGHEIGDHTYDHSDALEVSAGGFEESIRKNRGYFETHFPGREFATFAYPFGYLEYRTKNIAQGFYRCSRGAWRGINRGRIDLNLLRSFPLSGDVDVLPQVRKLLERTLRSNGWLVFLTHDVAEDPSNLGCTPRLLEEVLRYALRAGMRIATVQQASRLILECPN